MDPESSVKKIWSYLGVADTVFLVLLVAYLISAFAGIDGVCVYGPKGNRPRVATLAINVDGLPADRAGDMLDADFEVCVRPGLHCAPLVHEDEGTIETNGAIRFSPGYFSDDADIERAIAGVAALARFATMRR